MIEDPLFPYQHTGAEWLAKRRHGLLADDMGLGKSAQAIRAADLAGHSKILVICPAVARVNWEREFAKFSLQDPVFDVIISGADALKHVPSRSVVASYEMAVEYGHLWVAKTSFSLMVIDEVHFLKSVSAKRAKKILGSEGLAHKIKNVWAISGTPAPNNASELWPLLYTFGITPLSYDDFVKKYCHTQYVGAHNRVQITGTRMEMVPELRQMLSRIMLRRKKEDVLKELPPIFFGSLTVEATPPDIELLSSFAHFVFPQDRRAELTEKLLAEREVIAKILEGCVTWREGMKALEAMASSVSTLRRYNGMEKVPAVIKMLKDELSLGILDKVVIFAIHADVIESLREGLRDFGAVTLYGATPPEKRIRHIDNFQKNPKTRVFIGNIQACGTAVSLTAAHQVVFIEQDWVPGNNAQAAMRCHRIGQAKPVTVRVVTLPDSLDQRISELLTKKSAQLAAIFDEKRSDLLDAMEFEKFLNEEKKPR